MWHAHCALPMQEWRYRIQQEKVPIYIAANSIIHTRTKSFQLCWNIDFRLRYVYSRLKTTEKQLQCPVLASLSWLVHGFPLVTCLVCIDYVLIMYWLFIDYLLIIYWLFNDYVLIMYWLFIDYVLIVYWLCIDYLLILNNFSVCSEHVKNPCKHFQ